MWTTRSPAAARPRSRWRSPRPAAGSMPRPWPATPAGPSSTWRRWPSTRRPSASRTATTRSAGGSTPGCSRRRRGRGWPLSPKRSAAPRATPTSPSDGSSRDSGNARRSSSCRRSCPAFGSTLIPPGFGLRTPASPTRACGRRCSSRGPCRPCGSSRPPARSALISTTMATPHCWPARSIRSPKSCHSKHSSPACPMKTRPAASSSFRPASPTSRPN